MLGECTCDKDEDMFRAYEKQCTWRAKRPVQPMMRDPAATFAPRYATEVQVME